MAVKTLSLPASMAGHEEKREKMAIMEAAISTSLSHPNIVQTYTYSVVSDRLQQRLDSRMDSRMTDKGDGWAGRGGQGGGVSEGQGLQVVGYSVHP